MGLELVAVQILLFFAVFVLFVHVHSDSVSQSLIILLRYAYSWTKNNDQPGRVHAIITYENCKIC